MDSSIPTSHAAEIRGMRKWFLWALVISLGFHGILFLIFQLKKLEHFRPPETDTLRLVARAQFKGGRTSFPAKTFDDEREIKPLEPKKSLVPHPKAPAPVPEKPSAEIPETVTLTPKAQDLTKQLVAQKPTVNASEKLAPSQEKAVQHDLDTALTKQLLDHQSANSTSSTKIKLPAGNGGDEGADSKFGKGVGFSNLDSLLEQSGPLTGPVAPVSMPGGALFEYNSAALLPQAIATLRKIGELISRNPRATFSIEGHTDSFGTPEYNQKLSEARAEAVKTWLIEAMRLDPAQIQTKGFGSSHLIAPAAGTKEEQAINRRVEIVIRTPKQ